MDQQNKDEKPKWTVDCDNQANEARVARPAYDVVKCYDAGKVGET